jgi:hypothetical protein
MAASLPRTTVRVEDGSPNASLFNGMSDQDQERVSDR